MIVVETLLEPIVVFPEIVVRPVDAIFFLTVHVLFRFLLMGQQVKEVGNIIHMHVKKVIRIGADKSRDKISLVLGGVQPLVFTKQIRHIVVPAIHHNGDRGVPAVSGADTQVGQICIIVIKMGKERGSRFETARKPCR